MTWSWVPNPLCSPREWGWTDTADGPVLHRAVFPTRVGMDLPELSMYPPTTCVPHASGDGPNGTHRINPAHVCSPREWGWTAQSAVASNYGTVFPTRVGMDRRNQASQAFKTCVPHASGDGPTTWQDNSNLIPCSPREWGWTFLGEGRHRSG